MPPTAFAGQVVVFTGKLSLLGRREARALVERLGGTAEDDVTARTTLLVVGSEGFGRGAGPDKDSDKEEDGDGSRKLRKAEQINGRQPGQIAVIPEADFCGRAGLPSIDDLRQQFYGVRDIRQLYPAVTDDHLRYLEKWGLIHPVVRTNAQRYYGFADLLVLRQAAEHLAAGVPVRRVLRSLAATHDGQLALDFRSGRSDAQPARVVQLRRRPARLPAGAGDPQAQLAARYFLEGAAIDESEPARADEAMAAYRKALVLDPDLVPALVNLANIHYGQDELVEAQALYERAINLDPDCFEAYYNLGNIQHDLGRYDDARVAYGRALALNGGYAEAHFYLAVTLEKLGLSQEAKPHWRAYQHLAPEGEWVELAREFSE
jgi:tetratricopeptide (TPR) repeat protein